MKTLRVASVAQKLDLGVSTVWKLLKQDPTFPRPFRMSDAVGATVWVEHEIDAWLLTRMQSRQKEEPVSGH